MTAAAPLRSMLFVPGDSEKKLAKALGMGADALILDMEDSVVPARKPAARAAIAAFLKDPPKDVQPELWIRPNPLSTPEGLPDLVDTIVGRIAGVVIPKVDGPEDVVRLAHYLEALELRNGVAPGTVKILPLVTETARAPFSLGGFATAGLPRLLGLTWGAEDLATALGASSNRDDTGEWSLTYRMVRSMMLLAAKAAGVQAIETVYTDFRDLVGLRASSAAACREGFTGRVAIHPDQVAVFNEVFMPSADDVAFARRVLEAFAAAPQAGTVGLEGKMLDIPHLNQAKHVLALHKAYASKRK